MDLQQEFEQRVSESDSVESNEAIVTWLMSNGYSELDARQMLQFQLAVKYGVDLDEVVV